MILRTLATFVLAAIALTVVPANAKFITFTVPNCSEPHPMKVDNGGMVAGFCAFATGPQNASTYRGFVRTVDGTFVVFDAPGSNNGGTIVTGISKGVVVGYFFQPGSSYKHGFLGPFIGTFKTFDVPGATDMLPVSINNGVVTGTWHDSDDHIHSFVRATDGTITKFDVLGSDFTYASSVNSNGVIVGAYGNGGNHCCGHGFIRSSDGAISTFDAQGPVGVPNSYDKRLDINSEGAVAGSYHDTYVYGFVRSPGGIVTGFGVPNASYTLATTINSGGTIGGSWAERSTPNKQHAFVRALNGTIVSFDPPNSSFAYIEVMSINNSGAILGVYLTKNRKIHCFVRTS